MAMLTVVTASVFAMLLAWGGTRAFREYALWRGVVDVPNRRSSHTTPTPRGGGIAIVAATILAMLVITGAGMASWRHFAAIVGGGLLVAAVGYADDHRPVAPRWRLLGQSAAAGWLLWWLGEGAVPVTHAVLQLGIAGDAIALLFIVWLINLTNFMDGIDGIASVEGITVALGGCALLALANGTAIRWSMPAVLAGACAGFLAWNWPPAKIFMGDAGSGFLGFMLAALSLQAGQESLTVFWGWIILMAVFVTDATWTLARRLARGERIYQAHRSHGYQHAALRSGAHRPVTLAVLAINLCWLLPIASLVVLGVLSPLAGLTVAYAPLLGAALKLDAGGQVANLDDAAG